MDKKKLEVKYVKVSALTGWEKNPRKVDPAQYEALKRDITELSIYNPLLIGKDNVVYGGNMRLKAYRELNIDEVPVIVIPTDDKKRLMRIAFSDNNRAGYYEWGMVNALALEFPDFEWDMVAIDMKPPTLVSELLTQFREVTQDEAPSLSVGAPKSILGEVYQLGRHRLMCGDATNLSNVETLMDGKKAQMVFTDPPYNIDYEGGMNEHGKNKRGGILNDKMTDSKFYQFIKDSLSNLMKINEGVFYVCMSSKELPNLKTAFEEIGGHWQSYVIWVKTQFTLSRNDYQNQYEPILYGWSKAIKNHFFIDDRTMGNVWNDLGDRAKFIDGKTEITIAGTKLVLDGKVTGQILKGKRKTDIWEYAKPVRSEEHPTMKPIALCVEAIRNSSREEDMIVDTFGGSGSTLIACQQVNRTCNMMELDPKYCDVIRKRYAKFIEKESEWLAVTPKINGKKDKTGKA